MHQMYALRARKTGNSDLAELFKLAEQPDVISFAGGFPDPSWFLDEIEEIGREIFRDKKGMALQYGPVPGMSNLREYVAQRMASRSMGVAAENILIISGALQGLDLACRVFVDPGDTVVVEAPTYLGAISTIESYEACIASVPCDENGLNVDELETFLKTTPQKPKFITPFPLFKTRRGGC